MSSLVIVWFRRDLRLADNPALDAARRKFERVLPVFIHDPDAQGHWQGHWQPGAASRWWLHHSLREFSVRLSERGAPLVVRQGPALEELRRLVASTGASAVYWNRLYEPALRNRDSEIQRQLHTDGIEAMSFNASVLFEPWELVRDGNAPYKVFTPFWKRMQRDWRAPAQHPEPRRLASIERSPGGIDVADLGLLPRISWDDGLADTWSPGELGARRRLRAFAENAVVRYAGDRDKPDRAGTSRLSPHLHFGEVSPGRVALALDEAGGLPDGKGRLSFLREIAWRDFSCHLLHHFPETPDRPLNRRFESFPWRKRSDYLAQLEAWQRGCTGIPMVDAGMRELWQTGWMHNRVRMVVASFLTKNLLVPWHEGARWFWDTLVDADLANNTQGWQWTAGCGADAAPYFRVFNPVLQGQKFDPAGQYVVRWCPELERLPARLRHEPWKAEDPPSDYPEPIVDLKTTRRRALEAFERIKG